VAAIADLKEFAKQQFKAAQQPAAWLLSAERLRDGADAILKHELSAEIPYFRANKIAEEEAVAEAYSDCNDVGVAEIKAMPPNYPPAQLIYAYAIENVLKAPSSRSGQCAGTARPGSPHAVIDMGGPISGRADPARIRQHAEHRRTARPIRSCGCSSSAPIKSLRAGCRSRLAVALVRWL
jgi:hypothetical protein